VNLRHVVTVTYGRVHERKFIFNINVQSTQKHEIRNNFHHVIYVETYITIDTLIRNRKPSVQYLHCVITRRVQFDYGTYATVYE